MLFKRLYTLGDKFEDRARSKLSRSPILYAALGGTGIILFWRGIWHTTDFLIESFIALQQTSNALTQIELPWWDGPLSILIGTSLLLAVGLFVTSFIGDAIILSGLKGEKKLTEKTEDEVFTELETSKRTYQEIHEMEQRIKRIETLLQKPKK